MRSHGTGGGDRLWMSLSSNGGPMRFTKQMPLRLLADVLSRLSIGLSAGIDLRRAWASEISRVPAAWQPAMERVSWSLAQGSSLSASMQEAGTTFPPLVRAMVAVGDQTGHEAETLGQLAAALRHTVRTSRALVGSLVWPAFQLAAAIAVVGGMILLAGFIRDAKNRPVDVLGIGLSGAKGLTIYLLCLFGIALAAGFAFKRALASWHNRGIVRHVVDRIPVVGAASRANEAAAWCRAASLASASGLDIGRLVSLASAAAPGIRLDPKRIETHLRSGATLAEALRESRQFPERLLGVVDVGELTGSTAEVLDRLAGECDDEARVGFEAAAQGAGFAVWAIVAGLIVLVIFRIFSFYVAAIQDAASGL